MFKRANKITSLLVAAASVMALVPAYAADVKKIDSEDGTVYGAVAYKDGTALIDGEVNDNDAAYYFADGKYTELEDVDSGSSYTEYGDKYAKVDDGKDYNVDLSSGKVLDSDVASDDNDDAQTALRKAVKDVDRYGNPKSTLPTLNVLPGNKFGETWYSTTSYTSYTVYTDGKGNYIDADYSLGKIKVETTDSAATTKSATIENTKDAEDFYGTDGISATVASSKVLGQDKDYIYRYANIDLSLPAGAQAYGEVEVNNKLFKVTGATLRLPVIQKISKAQASDDVDDAKYAKSVTNYVISDDDVNSTTKVIDAGSATSGDLKTFYTLVQAYVNNTDSNKKFGASVVNGKLAVYEIDNTSSNSGDNVFVQAATLKQTNGYYYTDVEAQTSLTAEYSKDTNKAAADTDIDGNIYAIDGGYVKEFDGTDDWNKVYKVDGSFDALSVYDKNDMVAWSQGDEVYSVIGAKKADDTTTPTTPVTTAGWTQTSAGWTYTKADGTKATGWLQDGGAWYYLKADGTMATGWVQDGATWYYLNGSGAMQTGWLNDNGTWYYLNASGAMLANTTTPDGYYVGANGAWVK